MKIADIQTTVVTVPTIFPYGFSQGWSDGFTRTIVELETDDGEHRDYLLRQLKRFTPAAAGFIAPDQPTSTQ